mmetsp:Transcript_13717/g.57670  ORF Transcript_13717/g.57670 Transcript_13717/m.57670 type:complete len:206 (+) Transcript_13717:558-1175(+)
MHAPRLRGERPERVPAAVPDEQQTLRGGSVFGVRLARRRAVQAAQADPVALRRVRHLPVPQTQARGKRAREPARDVLGENRAGLRQARGVRPERQRRRLRFRRRKLLLHELLPVVQTRRERRAVHFLSDRVRCLLGVARRARDRRVAALPRLQGPRLHAFLHVRQAGFVRLERQPPKRPRAAAFFPHNLVRLQRLLSGGVSFALK